MERSGCGKDPLHQNYISKIRVSILSIRVNIFQPEEFGMVEKRSNIVKLLLHLLIIVLDGNVWPPVVASCFYFYKYIGEDDLGIFDEWGGECITPKYSNFDLEVIRI